MQEGSLAVGEWGVSAGLARLESSVKPNPRVTDVTSDVYRPLDTPRFTSPGEGVDFKIEELLDGRITVWDKSLLGLCPRKVEPRAKGVRPVSGAHLKGIFSPKSREEAPDGDVYPPERRHL